MNKILILFFVILVTSNNFANAMPLSRVVLSEEHLLVSDLIYCSQNENLYLITSNGIVIVFDSKKKTIIKKIDLGGKNAIYDHRVKSVADNEKSILYISFNRTLYLIDMLSNAVKNKIHLIENPDKIIVKSGSNKIWLLDTALGVLGSIDDVLVGTAKKDLVKYLKFVKRPQEVFFDYKLNKLYLIDSKAKFIYIVNGDDKIISTVDYRNEIKNVEPGKKVFNFVSEDEKSSEIVISQLKSFYKEKLYSLDEENHKLYIPVNDSILVFNLITNTFEKRFKNLPPSKRFIVSGGKIYLLFEAGNTGSHVIAVIDEGLGRLLDLTVLGGVKDITLDKKNKKIYALSEYVKGKPDYLINADLNETTLDKKSFLKQFDKLIVELDQLITSNKDIRMLKLYKNILPILREIKLIRGENKKELSCTSLMGNYIKDIEHHIKRFITPCVSGDDKSKPCLDYYRVKDLVLFLEAILAVDFNQNNISDFCEIDES